MTKIVLNGAKQRRVHQELLADILGFDELAGSTIALFDVGRRAPRNRGGHRAMDRGGAGRAQPRSSRTWTAGRRSTERIT